MRRRGGRIPRAYVSPPERRATRELRRRRGPLLRQRAEVRAPMQNTPSPSNLPELGQKRADKAHREGGAAHGPEPRVRQTLEQALARSAHDDQLLGEGELSIPRPAPGPDAPSFSRLPSGPGRGQLLALVLR